MSLPLHEFHQTQHARFTPVNGVEFVADYGQVTAEHQALWESAGVMDLSGRGRLCLLGQDRLKFLHGQVTNDVAGLAVGQGCYAALVNARAKMEADLFIHRLPDELLLDVEPGLAERVAQRLDKYIIADDVQVVDVASAYGLLSVQGPAAAEVVARLNLGVALPDRELAGVRVADANLGELHVMRHARLGVAGFDLFAPVAALGVLADKLIQSARQSGGRAVGWTAWEVARIEAGIPRYGIDMDETNLPPEAGLENRAISYQKGCYIGQEIIARIRTYGQVTKALRALRVPEAAGVLPQKGDKLLRDGREVGQVTSAVQSLRWGVPLALAYVRKEANAEGTQLVWHGGAGDQTVTVLALPPAKNFA